MRTRGAAQGGLGVRAGKTSERQGGEGVQSPPGTKGSQRRSPKQSPSSLSGRTLRRRAQAALQPWRGTACLLSSGATAQAAPSLQGLLSTPLSPSLPPRSGDLPGAAGGV